MTVQDLTPNSQDTSAFYLGSIYEVLADPKVARASVSSPALPPPFSPPRNQAGIESGGFLFQPGSCMPAYNMQPKQFSNLSPIVAVAGFAGRA